MFVAVHAMWLSVHTVAYNKEKEGGKEEEEEGGGGVDSD
jgi:hypothetical protein